MFVIFCHGLRVVGTAIGRSQYDCLLFYFDLRVNFKLCIDGPRRNTICERVLRQKELKKSHGRKVLLRQDFTKTVSTTIRLLQRKGLYHVTNIMNCL